MARIWSSPQPCSLHPAPQHVRESYFFFMIQSFLLTSFRASQRQSLRLCPSLCTIEAGATVPAVAAFTASSIASL